MNKDADSPPPAPSPEAAACLRRYWRQNVTLMIGLLSIWAISSLGCGILWADTLNQYKFLGTGYPLGFWFAQQGSIIVFVFVILIYCLAMNKLDARHHDELVEIRKREGANS